MKIEQLFVRQGRRCALALGLFLAATSAHAQPAPASGVSYAPPADEPAPAAAPASASQARPARAHSWIAPYLEVAQVVSADLDGGDTLTYTSVAVGVDGGINTRRVSVNMSVRYQRVIEWDDDVPDQDQLSGLVAASVQIIPGALAFDAGALATRTGGEGRVFGVTEADPSIEVYSAYAGPTVSTMAGPVAINASYRLGYVDIDDNTLGAGPDDGFDSATTHVATASVGMAPGELPIGWTVGAGYTRTESDSDFDDQFEAAYVRGDVVVPVSPTLAFTAGVGYEEIEANQLDIARDANGLPIIGPGGRPVPDPTRPRVLTYDLDGLIADAGVIWRPSSRTELQARVGWRYDSTTFVGSLSHQFSENAGMSLVVYDQVLPFANVLVNDISSLPDEFEIGRDPVTGSLDGCVFGGSGGTGACLDRSLQSISGSTFRLRGASLVISGERGLWSWGVGGGYANRHYGRPDDPAIAILVNEDENFGLFGTVGRQLSRSSSLDFGAYASWFDTDQADFNTVFTTGASVAYSRSFLLDRLRLIASLGLDHADDGTIDNTFISGLLGLRYTF
ncbi:MAG: hypothetical protein ACXWUR_13310 [Allosphingosinicella sp.]